MRKFLTVSGISTLLIGITYFLPYGTWADLGQLPAHPLIVHGVVVLLPLLSITLLAGIFKKDFFRKAHLILITALGVTTVGVLAAKSSGDSLSAAVGLPEEHAEWGNNAQLGLRLGLQADARFGEQDLGFLGSTTALNLTQLTDRVQASLQRPVTCVPGDGRLLRRLAWCSGGAQGYFEAAIAAGADAFMTGEISEPQAHLARESGVAFLACGHHATERYGAPALAGQVAARLGLAHTFIDIDNPA